MLIITYTVLHCVTLCCTVLRCVALLCCVTLCYAVLHCVTLCCTVHCVTLCYTVLHCYTVLNCVHEHMVQISAIPYSGKLSREKTFANFEVLWLFTKVFSLKFGGVASFGDQ